MAEMPPMPRIISTSDWSSSGMQSQSTLPFGCRNQQRPLADGEGWFHPDPVKPEFLQPDDASVGLPQFVERRPLLTAPADVLPLILADFALLRRLIGFGELGSARDADEAGHCYMTLQSGRPRFMCFVASFGSKVSGENLPPLHWTKSSCCSCLGSANASRNSS